METWDAITSRRNVRSYTDQAIAAEDLDRILEAGRRAPSARNRQPWDFIVVTDREQLRALSTLRPGTAHVAEAAAAIAVVTPRTEAPRERELNQFDLGQATMMMLIAATGLGIGSAHASVGENQELAREILGFPEDRVCPFLIALGHPADRPLRPITRPDRRPFDEVVHRGRW